MEKKYLITIFAIGLSYTSALANNNNNGEIIIQGVVPGTWEITVYDINVGYDFDLGSVEPDLTARIGTIYMYSNESTDSGSYLLIQSANAGRLINNSTIPGIASDNQKYMIAISTNGDTGLVVDYSKSSMGVDTDGYIYNNLYDPIVPGKITFEPTVVDGFINEGIYDIFAYIPERVGRAEAQGIYTDTLTFTIMDDN